MYLKVERFRPSSSGLADFRRFAEELYAGDPYWSHPPDPPLDDPSCACIVVHDRGEIVGRACTIDAPRHLRDDGYVRMCGWYECIDNQRVADTLLRAAAAAMRVEDMGGLMIGPMNVSTWHRYRVAEPSDAPPFFLDVYNKPWYAEQWRRAGAEELEKYISTSFEGLIPYPRHDRAAELRDARGVVVRELDLSRIDDELRTLYRLSIEGFKDNFLYTHIAEEDFIAMYRPIVPLVKPELVLIADSSNGDPIGFVFAIDNITERTRKSLVMKSATVLPEYRGIGLGHHLLERVHRTALERGYQQIIHALMHVDNRSTAILADRATPYREYTLFGYET